VDAKSVASAWRFALTRASASCCARRAFIATKRSDILLSPFEVNGVVLREVKGDDIFSVVRTEDTNNGLPEWAVNFSGGPCGISKQKKPFI